MMDDDFLSGISPTEREHIERYIHGEVEAHGAVRPPWLYADWHPFELGWRMGGGESHVMAFHAWWSRLNLSIDERIGFVRRWKPPPFWFPWSARLIWSELELSDEGDVDEGDFDEADRRAVERLEAAGLGSLKDWDEANRVLDATFQAEDG